MHQPQRVRGGVPQGNQRRFHRSNESRLPQVDAHREGRRPEPEISLSVILNESALASGAFSFKVIPSVHAPSPKSPARITEGCARMAGGCVYDLRNLRGSCPAM